jgi:ABC-type multidrug transport system ATPase subunit
MIALNEGEISIFGKKVGAKRDQKINSRIGYMPQEIGLIGQLTVKESIYYFGKIFFMKFEKIKERYEMLSALLELPPSDRRIDQCSGGQMRRISFAVSMIHDPDLIILDEPTVGVDPLLREKIWDFLVDISKTRKATIIITTHYIEEARKADRVSFMRSGNLLLEGATNRIINHFQAETLDDVFLHLCMREENTKVEIPGRSIEDFVYEEEASLKANFATEGVGESPKTSNNIFRLTIIKALIVKNWAQMKRHTE